MPPQPMNDVGAIDRLEEKTGLLHKHETATRKGIMRSQQQLIRATADIEMELATLKQELEGLDLMARKTVVRVKDAIGLFRQAVKRADLTRLQQRVDLWAPERKMTRTQFQRMLVDEMGS